MLKPLVIWAAVWAWCLVLLTASPARALPPNFQQQTLPIAWNQAVGIVFAADGRMVVWEKAGRIWMVENGVRNPVPMLDISEEVGDWRDLGLLGVALDPAFLTNGRIYLYYTVDYHHLTKFGTPAYSPTTDEYFIDTIGRVTRYTARVADGFRSVDPATRFVLLGETITTGVPCTHQSHMGGGLLFGDDGTLLLTTGDGASYEVADVGGPRSGSSNTALADGIITPSQDVGAYRTQQVDSLSGKILRLDPATGNGVPSNPFFDASNPRLARSRIWAMGFRNPFRMGIRSGSGSANPADARPGQLFIGDVGWNLYEEVSISTAPGQNFGWPLFEGLGPMNEYLSFPRNNPDAVNPLFNGGSCNRPRFRFEELLIQDRTSTPSWPNPCNAGVQIAPNTPRFMHRRPAVEWAHGGGSRTGTFAPNGSAATISLTDPASPVPGPEFDGFSATGGVFYSGTAYPAAFRHTYYFADFVRGWIRMLDVDSNGAPLAVRDFAANGEAGAPVCFAVNPVTGEIHYLAYNEVGASSVRRIFYTDNAPPIAKASASARFGPTPLAVQFSSASSTDPEGGTLRYEWDFGDGSPIDRSANPTHTFFNTEDITSHGTIVAKVFSLSPPNPIGGGSQNPQIIRDGDRPPVGNTNSARQYDTFHAGAQGNEDWIGYTFNTPRQLRTLVFQEGMNFFNGGWFNSLKVQLLVNGVWIDAAGLSVSPNYQESNSTNYQTYILTWQPVLATGVRLYGQPGGSAGFISVAELRVHADYAGAPPPTRRDVTLKVLDPLNNFATASVVVSLDNTPPALQITSLQTGPVRVCDNTTVPLTANITDAESPGGLTCAWQTIIHHDDHTHPEPINNACASSTVLSPHGGAIDRFFFEVRLTVSDNAGLSTTRQVFLYPFCCQVDFTRDGLLDQEDLGGFITSFLAEPADPGPGGFAVPCPDQPAPFDQGYQADFNRDCAFNQEDLSGFITEYFSEVESPNTCTPG